MIKSGVILLLCLVTGCSKPQNRMQTHARDTGLQAIHEFPVYIDLRFPSSSDAPDQINRWFTSHSFRRAGSAFDPKGNKVSDSFGYKDLIEASVARIGSQTWVMAYGILADDQALRPLLEDMIREVKSGRQMEVEEVKLP